MEQDSIKQSLLCLEAPSFVTLMFSYRPQSVFQHTFLSDTEVFFFFLSKHPAKPVFTTEK